MSHVRLRSVALTVAALGVGSGWAWPAAVLGQRADPGPTYTRDVAPILFRSCAACHRPSGPAPFSVLTYRDVQPFAQAMADATVSGRMPPWLPERGVGEFAGERWLTDQEIALLKRWVEAGAREGDPADLAPAPAFAEGWQLGEPDLVVTLPTYEVPANAVERYRNLVAPIPVSRERWVSAVEVRPGSGTVVHHATMSVDTTASSSELAAEDPEPGFDGMHLQSAATHPGGFFVGWTPGRVATAGSDSLAWRLMPGTDVVLQVHIRPSGTPQTITPRIGFHFAPGPPSRWPAVIMLGSSDIDIPPGKSDYTVTDSYVLPVDVDVLGLYPHAHYLGKELEAFARLPNGRTQWLMRIKNWDFNWQDEYRYARPMALPRGTTLTMRWRYDNSARNPRNPNSPPRRVLYGSRSADEMADLVLQVLPRTREDRDVLERDIGWKYVVDRTGTAARRAYGAAVELAGQGRHAEAVERFREAVSHSPSAEIHAALAESLIALGQRGAAVLHLQEALRMAESAGDRAVAGEIRRRLQTLRD